MTSLERGPRERGVGEGTSLKLLELRLERGRKTGLATLTGCLRAEKVVVHGGSP